MHGALRAATLLRALQPANAGAQIERLLLIHCKLRCIPLPLESRGGQIVTYIGMCLQIVESSRPVQWSKEAGC